MLAKKYKSELININNPFKGIYTLEFKSLNGRYKYHPGQFLHLALDPNYDGSSQWPESRCFSMQSNPDQENIKITIAVKGKFTQQMKEKINVGSELWLKLPYGDLFTKIHNKVNTVFIAGGTGITPFLSLFTHVSFADYKSPILFAGFRNIELNIYLDQLEQAKKINSGLQVYLIYQDKNGIMDIEKIYHKSDKDASFFISGPPLMIHAFKRYLVSKGAEKDQIQTDDWE